ncbi:MAG: ABC transporter ATP-binding protein [Candidatus Aenigmarchaeota archaeon]|nr:ABC transporter ATP-binding protein [Candidatus Aenigmarchaeota archaeon]
MKKVLFELKDVWKIYCMKGTETQALRDISLKIENGEYVAIVGQSGSGKSTLMHVIGCLDTPTRGSVVVDGKEISQLEDDDLAKIRREKIGFVFQAFNLIDSLTAAENVAMPMRFNGYGKAESIKRAKELLKRVGLEKRVDHKPNQLSGGEQQRVAICRALANDPEIILADEPTGNLDSRSGSEIIALMEELHKSGKTIIMVTHDQNLAKRAKRQIKLKDGQIVNE